MSRLVRPHANAKCEIPHTAVSQQAGEALWVVFFCQRSGPVTLGLDACWRVHRDGRGLSSQHSSLKVFERRSIHTHEQKSWSAFSIFLPIEETSHSDVASLCLSPPTRAESICPAPTYRRKNHPRKPASATLSRFCGPLKDTLLYTHVSACRARRKNQHQEKMYLFILVVRSSCVVPRVVGAGTPTAASTWRRSAGTPGFGFWCATSWCCGKTPACPSGASSLSPRRCCSFLFCFVLFSFVVVSAADATYIHSLEPHRSWRRRIGQDSIPPPHTLCVVCGKRSVGPW